jgi:RND family efflux transporter MFP subunit
VTAPHSVRAQWWIVTVAGLLGACVFALAWLTLPSNATTRDGAPSPRIVETSVAASHDGRRSLRVSGVTRAIQHARLSFTIGGRLASRSANVGDRVDAGTVLAQLDRRPLQNALRLAIADAQQAATELRQARRDRRRARKLARAQAIARADLEHAQSSARSFGALQMASHAAVDEARRMLDEAALRAPYDGLIGEVLVEPGEFVAPGQPVVALFGEVGLEIEVEVPESVLGRILVGSAAIIDLPLVGRPALRGTVHSIGRTASAGHVFPVIVRLADDPGIVVGMAADVTLDVQDDPGVTIPLPAVIDPGGQQSAVFRVDDGVARRLDVELGDLVGDRVRVEEGLLPGDFVIVDGHAALVDGDSVEVRP